MAPEVRRFVERAMDWRRPIANATDSLFSHGPDPLAETLCYRGDPGLFGPDSATWPILGDVAVFVGAIRALLIQAAHPEVAAGVSQHSRYREDPLGRLSRTSGYVTAVAFGARPEAESALATVARRHRGVSGTSARGVDYRADMRELGAWVHNSLTDSFLVAYEQFGADPLPPGTADRFVAEQAELGELLGVGPVPTTREDLNRWLLDNQVRQASTEQQEALEFLAKPPLDPLTLGAYGFLYRAAVATLPGPTQAALGVRPSPGAVSLGRVAVATLRWALGSSPSWSLALARVGREPDRRLRQSLPTTPDRSAPEGALDGLGTVA